MRAAQGSRRCARWVLRRLLAGGLVRQGQIRRAGAVGACGARSDGGGAGRLSGGLQVGGGPKAATCPLRAAAAVECGCGGRSGSDPADKDRNRGRTLVDFPPFGTGLVGMIPLAAPGRVRGPWSKAGEKSLRGCLPTPMT